MIAESKLFRDCRPFTGARRAAGNGYSYISAFRRLSPAAVFEVSKKQAWALLHSNFCVGYSLSGITEFKDLDHSIHKAGFSQVEYAVHSYSCFLLHIFGRLVQCLRSRVGQVFLFTQRAGLQIS
jgi:hypothetical protein